MKNIINYETNKFEKQYEKIKIKYLDCKKQSFFIKSKYQKQINYKKK